MISSAGKAWVGYFLSYNKTINESFLFLNLPLLLVELVLHLLELPGQEVILLSDLLSSDSEDLVLFLGLNKVGSYSAELTFSLVDLLHVIACLKAALLDQL